MKFVAIDTETNGLDPYKEKHKPFLFLAYDGKNYINSYAVEDIYDYLQDTSIIKIFHNAKFDLHMLRSIGIEVKGPIHDTQVAAHLYDENAYSGMTRKSGLKYLAREILGESTDEEEAINDWFKQNKIKKDERKYDDLPEKILIKYGKKDVLYTYKLYKYFIPKLKEQELFELYETECNLLKVLLDMEYRGVIVNVTKAADLYKQLTKKINRINSTIVNKYGTINLKSPKQLGPIFKKEIGNGIIYTEKGSICTNKKALKDYALKSNLAKLMLKFRDYIKLRDTYCAGLINAADENDTIHCSFVNIGTVTGRFSSRNPNLQNIPRVNESNSEEGNLIRSLFLVRPGFTNYYLDYKQIEYRIAADYAEDEDLITRINNGEDVHTIMASRIFKKEIANVTKEERSKAKTINFAKLYGAGKNIISSKLEINLNETNRIIKAFNNSNKKLISTIYAVEKAVRKKGFIFNKFNRYRRLDVRDAYKAFNALCQGCAADIMKVAMVKIHEFLIPYESQMLVNVHDEIHVEVKKGEEFVVKEVKRIMEDFDHLFEVKIATSVEKSRTNWSDKKEVKKL